MSKVIGGPVIKIREFVDKLSLGMHPGKIELKLMDEIGDIASEIETNSEKKNMIDYFVPFNKIIIKLEDLKNQLL